MPNENTISRRGLFMKLGILFNGLVATALAVPIVRFLLSSVTRGRASAYLSWVPLGHVSEFPEGETRLATFRNRAPRLSGSLVSAVRTIHVPMPWWCVLP
jgi:hypothetical protein